MGWVSDPFFQQSKSTIQIVNIFFLFDLVCLVLSLHRCLLHHPFISTCVQVSIMIWESLGFATLCYVLYKINDYRKCNVPGPRGLPVVGNALQIRDGFHKCMTEWSKEYGDVFQVSSLRMLRHTCEGIDIIIQCVYCVV